MSALAAVIGTMREEATVLAKNGAAPLAEVKRRDAAMVEQAMPDATQWLSEDEAMLRSGWTRDRVRRHARLYEGTPYVERHKSGWRLLAIVVPQRLPISMAQRAARRAAEEGA